MFNINSRILISAASIAAAGALVVGATFAYFSDTQTSSRNVFAAGTLNLALCDGNKPCPDPNTSQSVTATFGKDNMAPGDCTDTQNLTVKNNGSVDANHVDISASNDNTTLAQFLKLDTLTYNASNVLPLDSNGNGFIDLDDLRMTGLTNLLPGLTAGNSTTLAMKVCLDTSATTAIAGQSDDLTLTVKLDQGPHI